MNTSPTQSSGSGRGHLGLMGAYLLIITLTTPLSFMMGDAVWSRWFYAVRRTCKVDAFMTRAVEHKKKC